MESDKQAGPSLAPAVSQAEIVQAHNLLNAVLTGKVTGLTLGSLELVNLYAYRDFACWLLGHTAINPTVERVLAQLRHAVQAQGYDLDQVQARSHNGHVSPETGSD